MSEMIPADRVARATALEIGSIIRDEAGAC
jgi:hypothetical protein